VPNGWKNDQRIKSFVLHKVLSRRGGTMRFIRWSFFNPLENFLNLMLSRTESSFQLSEKLA
jgi:hypothetical protein